MSVNFYVYIGSYLRVTDFCVMGKEPITICDKCGKRIDTLYCPDCGGQRVEKEIQKIYKDYWSLIEELGPQYEEDYFKINYNNGYDDSIYIGFNKNNKFHICIDDSTSEIVNLPEQKAEESDWGILIDVLKEKKINYILCHNIIGYYY